MLVEKQEPYECILSTIGALSGIPVAQLRDYGTKWLHSEFTRVIRCDLDYNNETTNMLHWGLVSWLCKYSGVPIDSIMPPPITDKELRARDNIKTLPAGKGALHVRFFATNDNSFVSQHACPFENKMIYDPNWEYSRLRGVNLQDFLEYYRNNGRFAKILQAKVIG